MKLDWRWKWIGAAALLCACRAPEAAPAAVLDHGDAEWPRPPFDPPGGDGEPSNEGEPDGGGGATAGYGTGGDDPTGWGGSTTSGPDTDGDSSSSSSGGDSDTDTDGTDTVTNTDASTSGSEGDGKASIPRSPDLAEAPRPLYAEQDPLTCPDTQDPVVLYMSNDDSNSQASPILVRRIVGDQQIVDPNRVRIHEFLNYYDLSYDNPSDAAAQVGIQMRRIDEETDQFVLLLYAQGKKVDPATRPPMNLVFSADTSGSMSGEPIALLRETMRATAASLEEGDVVSIVEWESSQAVPLEGYTVTGPNDPVLLDVIDDMEADGSTDLHGGLVRAYELANAYYRTDRLNRVMLLSDGGANTGVTDIDLIAAQAEDSDGAGIYLVGVGVGDASGYSDTLMDEVTDAGKGAYVFVDREQEAHRMFEEHFVQNMMVAARNVQMELTLPWYFGIKEFHGEEYSADPAEVEPQHLAPNDAMSFHQIIQSCGGSAIYEDHQIKAKATYADPITLEQHVSELEVPIGQLVVADAKQLYKGDVVVAYAQAFIVIGDLWAEAKREEARTVAHDMVQWLTTAEQSLADPEVAEMTQVMTAYASVLEASE